MKEHHCDFEHSSSDKTLVFGQNSCVSFVAVKFCLVNVFIITMQSSSQSQEGLVVYLTLKFN